MDSRFDTVESVLEDVRAGRLVIVTDDEKRASLSPAEFAQYLKGSYSRTQLLGIQMFLRNEEFNEIGNQILSDLLRESDTKENTHDN